MNAHETQEQLRAALEQVERWERDQKDVWFWEKIGRIPFMLLGRLTPKLFQDKIGQALDELGSFLQSGGKYLASEQTILNKLNGGLAARGLAPVPAFTSVAGLPLELMDQTADQLASSRADFATVQGATTGIGGLFTLAIDIPALLGLQLKVIQEIAMCYGFDPKDGRERVFVVKCLQFAASDIVGKRALLDELALFDTEHRQANTISQLQGWREVLVTYTENFGWKKLFQLIPIAGMLFGAFLNRGALKDVAEAATMLYRKRRILHRLKSVESA